MNSVAPPSTDPAATEFDYLSHSFGEHSPHPLFTVHAPHGAICHANDAFLKLSNLAREKIVGQHFIHALPASGAVYAGAMIERVLATKDAESIAEQQHPGEPTVYWSYAAWPVHDKQGAILGAFVQVIDTTETANFRRNAIAANEALILSNIRHHELIETFQALNAQLQHAIQDKEYFIAVLSHELRTPLTPILIAALMLQKDTSLTPDARELMAMIHRNATLEARLIDDLLDITRVERGKLNLDRRPLDLRVPLRHAIETVDSDIKTNGLSLIVNIADEPQPIAGDVSRLEQVFSNLLRNAIKFTPAGGTITVRSWCEAETCVAQVIDTGAGIAPEFIPRAFSPFEQADRTHARKGGLGLGLTICKTIMDLHGGIITASSDGPNLGSTFTVRLPFAAAGAGTPAPSATDTPIRPLKILLVEDHPDTARTMRRLLSAEGHDVQWAPDVSTGLQLSAEHPFDLLLSDIGLPDGSGVDLMRAIRQRGSLLPGIVLSGFGQEQDIARSRDAGFSAHLLKPISLSKLHEAMAALVS